LPVSSATGEKDPGLKPGGILLQPTEFLIHKAMHYSPARSQTLSGNAYLQALPAVAFRCTACLLSVQGFDIRIGIHKKRIWRLHLHGLASFATRIGFAARISD
jgi:hypothetical protein